MSVDIREIAREEAERAVDSHEDICAERYKGLTQKIETVDASVGRIWSVLAWVGTSAFGLIIGLLAFLAKAQWDMVGEMQKAAIQRSVIREQIQNAPPPQVIVRRAEDGPEIGATVERQP